MSIFDIFESKDEFKKRYYETVSAIEHDQTAKDLFDQVEKIAIEYVETVLMEETYKKKGAGTYVKEDIAHLDDVRKRKHEAFLSDVTIFKRYIDNNKKLFPNYPVDDVFKGHNTRDRYSMGDWALNLAKTFHDKLIRDYKKLEAVTE